MSVNEGFVFQPTDRWEEVAGLTSVTFGQSFPRRHPAGSPLSRRCALAAVRALQARAFRRQQERL